MAITPQTITEVFYFKKNVGEIGVDFAFSFTTGAFC